MPAWQQARQCHEKSHKLVSMLMAKRQAVLPASEPFSRALSHNPLSCHSHFLCVTHCPPATAAGGSKPGFRVALQPDPHVLSLRERMALGAAGSMPCRWGGIEGP